MAFEEWAVVELMGHQKIAGKVSEATIAGGSMLRVDVPDVPGQAGFTRYLGTSAIYAINPCSEDVARRAAAYQQVQPIRSYELAPALPAAPTHKVCGKCGERRQIGIVRNGTPLCDPCFADEVPFETDTNPTSPVQDVDGPRRCGDCDAPVGACECN